MKEPQPEAGGVEVGHGLYQADIAGEGVFDEVLAEAGDRRAPDGHSVAALFVDIL